MRRGTAKDALVRHRWSGNASDWVGLRLVIRHRGAPGDELEIDGRRLTHLGPSFFELDGETSIPYHRILRIYASGSLVYDRAASPAMRS